MLNWIKKYYEVMTISVVGFIAAMTWSLNERSAVNTETNKYVVELYKQMEYRHNHRMDKIDGRVDRIEKDFYKPKNISFLTYGYTNPEPQEPPEYLFNQAALVPKKPTWM